MSRANHRRQRRRQKIDALIDWHQAKKPAAGVRLTVSLTPRQLKRILGQAPRPGSADEFLYRGATLVATGVDAVIAPREEVWP
jgi:hypothetical protein